MTGAEQTGYDYAVIGAGIAGASVAAFLAPHGHTVIVERERFAGEHTTGRSAALFFESYGNCVVRALTRASAPFMREEAQVLIGEPVLSPRGIVFVGRSDQEAALREGYADSCANGIEVEWLDEAGLLARVPIMREGYAVGAMSEPTAQSIDVDRLHQGFLRMAKAQGADRLHDQRIDAIMREGDGWRIDTGNGAVRARVVVNAAGAWADEVASLAGAAPLGLAPLRRTAVTIPLGPEWAEARWPFVIDVDEQFYFKIEAGKLLASPADETPSPPCDSQPEDIDVAICVDRLQTATTLEVRRVEHAWAGLRTFAPDRSPVIGPDPSVPGFHWFAGLGGFGIQTSPACGRIAAALARGEGLPDDAAACGVRLEDILPDRLVGASS